MVEKVKLRFTCLSIIDLVDRDKTVHQVYELSKKGIGLPIAVPSYKGYGKSA